MGNWRWLLFHSVPTVCHWFWPPCPYLNAALDKVPHQNVTALCLLPLQQVKNNAQRLALADWVTGFKAWGFGTSRNLREVLPIATSTVIVVSAIFVWRIGLVAAGSPSSSEPVWACNGRSINPALVKVQAVTSGDIHLDAPLGASSIHRLVLGELRVSRCVTPDSPMPSMTTGENSYRNPTSSGDRLF